MTTGVVRARVLKTEGAVAELGVLVDGSWRRVRARTETRLAPGDWIEGQLLASDDGASVIFKMTRRDPGPANPGAVDDGLDFEA